MNKFVRIGLFTALVGALTQSVALADPPCGRGWRKHEACGPVYVAPPAIRYYEARPAYPAPQIPFVVLPPPAYAPAPAVIGVPSVQLGVSIPLR